jgi:hypothetical protein
MARMVGRTKSWVWWLTGVVCAVVFGRAAAGEPGPQPEYGIRIRRPRKAVRPAVTEQQRKQAARLVDEYMSRKTAKLSEKDRRKIAGLIADLGSDSFARREAASEAVVKYGARALKQLEAALKSDDAEVVQRARAAIGEIRGSGGDPLVARLRGLRAAALEVIRARRKKWRDAAHSAELQSIALQAQDKERQAGKKLEEKKAAEKKAARLAALLALVGSGAAVTTATTGPAPVVRPDRPQAAAKYGVRVMRPKLRGRRAGP